MSAHHPTSLYDSPAKRAVRHTHKPKPSLPFVVPLLLCFGAGLIFSFALAPYKIWALALISPMVLYACLQGDVSGRQAFLLGWAYGFGVWLLGAFWLYTSIHEYGAVSALLALLMIVLMAGAMGLFHACMAWVFGRFLGKQPLAFASLWVLQEWAKTWLLTGFPWLFVGYAFTDLGGINALAPVTGVLGIGFLAVLCACSVVALVRGQMGYIIISLLGVAATLILSAVHPTWTKPTGKSLSFSLVQGNIPQDMKWLLEYRFQTLEIYAKLSQSEWGRDVVVWPEASIPMFQDEAWEFLVLVQTVARQNAATWVTGIPYRDLENFDPRTSQYPKFYNGVLAFGEGSGGLYKKQHLVPFGEYVPLAGYLDLLPDLAGMQDVASFSRGNKDQAPLMIKNHPMGSLICYEVAYPITAANNAKGSEFLLTISNDAWFGTSSGPYQHLQMVQMRSLETGRWFVRATNTGVTAFIDDRGQIVRQAPQFTQAVLRADVPMMTGQTPFMRFGHMPILAVAGLLILLSFVAKRQLAYRDGVGIRD